MLFAFVRSIADEAAVNVLAAGELREGVDVFDKHAASETKRFAKD
jgi:hypothetical protein